MIDKTAQLPADSAPARPGLHRFATVLAYAIVLLIAAGALVKSKEAGLSVPDWPLSYGSLNPSRWWAIDTVRSEHGHRLFAGTVAMATFVLAVWTARVEPRRWVRRLAWSSFGAVLAQAVLGGITVLFFLPPAVSIAHAALAELFLCLVTSVAVVTGPGFRSAADGDATADPLGRLPALATATTIIIFAQILAGAVMRHLGAGLAIPDFPLVFGGLVPPHFTLPIAIHYIHRVGALVVAGMVFWTGAETLRRRGALAATEAIDRPAMAMMALVVVQIALGGAIVLTGRAVLPNTVHVATGAALLATSLVLSLRAGRAARLAQRAGAARRPAGEPAARRPRAEAIS